MCLTLPIGPGDMPTDTALLAGVFRVHQDHRCANQLRLVLHETAQLGKRPARHLGALRLPEPRPSPDALKVFKGYAFPVAYGRRNERLTNTVVGIFPKPRFPFGSTFQRPPNVFGALPIHLRAMRRTLQPLASRRIARATCFNRCAAMGYAVRSRCQGDHAQVDAEKVGWGKRRAIGYLDHDQQKPRPIPAYHQMALTWFVRIEALLVVGIQKEHDQCPASHGQQAHRVETGKPHEALIVGHGRVRAERGAHRLVTPGGACDPCQAADGHLCGQSKPTAQLMVEQTLQRQFVAALLGKCLLGEPIARCIKARHGLSQGCHLLGCREEFELQG